MCRVMKWDRQTQIDCTLWEEQIMQGHEMGSTTQIECTLWEEQIMQGHEMGSITQIECTLWEEQIMQGHEMGSTIQIECTLWEEQIMRFHCELFFEQHSILMKDERGRRSVTSIHGDTLPSNGRYIYLCATTF